MRILGLLLVLGLICAQGLDALACRYNVRETGFVDFGIGYYRLFCFVDSEMSTDEQAQLESLAAEVLAEQSIMFELVVADEEPDHPALTYMGSDEDRTLPSAVLVSPMGHSIQLGDLGKDRFSLDQFKGVLESAVTSPVRSKIAEELAAAFAVVLMVEGREKAENSRARTILLQAIETLESELEYFPKPIKRGAALIPLTHAEIASESLLLRSFGVEPEEVEQPFAAVLYGKGRWIGPLMIGDEITLDLVCRVLFLVGADCECDLDPRLLRGTGIPLPWNSRLQEMVSKDLGFDPDNPLVRMEVAQIMKVNSWHASLRNQPVQDAEIPDQPDNTEEETSRLFSFRFLYLIGGLLGVVIFLGVAMWIRAGSR